jgi:MFS family permease
LLTSNLEGVQNLSLGALEAFLPIYAVKIVGLSAFQAGLLWGVQVVATIASKPIMGRLSDRYGRRPSLLGIFLAHPALIPGSDFHPILRPFSAW